MLKSQIKGRHIFLHSFYCLRFQYSPIQLAYDQTRPKHNHTALVEYLIPSEFQDTNINGRLSFRLFRKEHTNWFSSFVLISLARVRKASSTLILVLAEISKNLNPYSSANFSPRSFVTYTNLPIFMG